MRYRAWSHYLKEKFGEKVYKISIDAGFSCPNRDGTLVSGGCTYCDEGSRAPGVNPALSIPEQVQEGMKKMESRYGAKKFIAYFQAYTNTYAHVDILRKRYFEALNFPEIVGLSVSTRPDTISEGALDLLDEISRSYEVWLEIGLQTIHNKTNERLNRWHTFQQFENALTRAKQRPHLKICTHVILGLPGESTDAMHETINTVAKLPLDGIKIHLLHVIKNTKLHESYLKEEFKVLDENEYISLVCDFLEKLPPSIIIHRLTGEAEPQKMVAPLWILNKSQVLRKINDEMEHRFSYQGIYYK